MKRNKHNLSHYHLTSFDMGELIPVGNVEVLPGDSMQQVTSALVRVTPQLKPLMHPCQVRIHHFYVPYRLLWSGWEDFITGEDGGAPPTLSGGAHVEGNLRDYLGVYNDATNDYSPLHVRAYNKIYNDFYRDQDLIAEVSEDATSVRKVSWAKDQFTAARPWAQKGQNITLPVGTRAPVMGLYGQAGTAGQLAATWHDTNGDVHQGTHYNAAANSDLAMDSDGTNPEVYADLSSADALNIRDWKEALGLQKYQEARARYGSNYVDYLKYIGVNPSDSRLQRPEYLGGGRQSLSFSEVLNTSDTNTGAMVGHGIAAMRTNKYRRYFEEHGVIMTMMSVRPKSIYVQGLPKKFSKLVKEDYWQRELENIGQQEVYNKEILATHSDPDGVFGYSDRYQEYREEESRVSGEFRNSTSYDWHLGRIFSSDIALNQSFIECAPTKRCFADQTNKSLWVMVNHSIQARRMVSRAPSQRGGY
jgi:hypothetical protein